MEPTSSGGPLWDGEKKFWHCHSDTDTQIFTDTLYGQMLAHHHLQNYTVRCQPPDTRGRPLLQLLLLLLLLQDEYDGASRSLICVIVCVCMCVSTGVFLPSI
eukprot:SAG11_NODE_6880_length_1232_cov_1.195057_2_plen_102_part_00